MSSQAESGVISCMQIHLSNLKSAAMAGDTQRYLSLNLKNKSKKIPTPVSALSEKQSYIG